MVDAGKINVLVLDVDGVLTDGSLMIHGDGSESKTFNGIQCISVSHVPTPLRR